jgi:hypothetical protein
MNNETREQKTPIEKSFDSMLGAATKDLQNQVNEKVRQVVAAKKSYETLVHELHETVEEMELTKSELRDILKGI